MRGDRERIERTHAGESRSEGRLEEHQAVIQPTGTTHAAVIGNVVRGNLAAGGIALNDDGPYDTAPLTPDPVGTLHPSVGNVVEGNTVGFNTGGCGIVLSSYNVGAGVLGNTVVDNTVTDTPGTFTPRGPSVSGIVLAGQLVENNRVVHNLIHGTFMPGIVLHSNTPAEVLRNNEIVNNTLTDDDWGMVNGPASTRVGIILGSAAGSALGELSGTSLVGNSISHEDVGIYGRGATGTRVVANTFDDVTTPESIS